MFITPQAEDFTDFFIYQARREIWKTDAALYARERLGFNPTWQQQSILNSISKPNARVSCRSGHGVGKTGATAASVLWFIETRDYPKIPCTAPTSTQLRDVLWSELAKWIRNSDRISEQYNVSREFWLSNLFTLTRDRLYDPSAKGEWYAVARTSGKDNPDALQGFHASNVIVSMDGKGLTKINDDDDGHIMFVIDEASGVYEKVFEVAEGALASHGARLLMIGNPIRTDGYFADSHKKDRSQFTSLHFKSADSPLVDPEYRKRLVRKYGEGSNIVRIRADGEFPTQEADVLIPLEVAEAAIICEPGTAYKTADIRLGIDPARFGDDRTVFVIRQGNVLLYAEIATKKDTMWVAGKAIALRRRFNANNVYVDEIGIGAGVVDRLNELREPVIGVNVASASPTREGEQARLMRDYLWLEMADWMIKENPSFILLDKEIAGDLAGELASAKYDFDSSGKTFMKSKDSQKKILGHSPDIADAVGVTFADTGGIIYIG